MSDKTTIGIAYLVEWRLGMWSSGSRLAVLPLEKLRLLYPSATRIVPVQIHEPQGPQR